MNKRASMLLAIPVALLVIASGFLVMHPAGAANQTGVTLTHHAPHLFMKQGSQSSNVQPLSGNNLIYGGGPVMTGTTNVYAIFWEPGGNVSANYNSLIKRYFGDIGGSPLYQIANQYTQSGGGFPSNAVLAGSWVDSGAYTRNPSYWTVISRTR